jgi:hydrogenase nickel incorporation protein HypB
MCDNCGCGKVEGFSVHATDGKGEERHHAHPHEHSHADASGRAYWHTHDDSHGAHEHSHGPHSHDAGTAILALNDRHAERNRGWLRAKGVSAVNLLSSPGAGKTTLLEATAARLQGKTPCAVIVGDLETMNDAARLRAKGVSAVQITTGTVCHLDAQMVGAALERVELGGVSLLFIENVGNLVCPASYDLGEDCRVVLMPVTEGEDKPLKYPPIFNGCSAVVISKTDLAAAVGFDSAAARANIARVAPGARIIELSARTGEGMDAWMDFLAKLPGHTAV